MIIKEEQFKDDSIADAAKAICLAARTAPKTRGIDVVETAIVLDDSVKTIIGKMKEISERTGRQAYSRNSVSLEQCSCIVLIGVKRKTQGLSPCGYCMYKDCKDNEEHNGICAYNNIDLGIAVGSAVSKAADLRLDNRIMWTIGIAAKELGIFDKSVEVILGIPLSVSGKNIFFDRG